MKTKLITALRIAANALENNSFHYDWQNARSCNCGVVACAILGKNSHQLYESLAKILGGNSARDWTEIAGRLCPVTGIPQDEVFGELSKCGMTAQDIHELEYLRNSRVLARCDFGTERIESGRLWWKRTIVRVIKADHKNKKHVIIYLRAWAVLLTEDGAQDSAEHPAAHIAPAPSPRP